MLALACTLAHAHLATATSAGVRNGHRRAVERDTIEGIPSTARAATHALAATTHLAAIVRTQIAIIGEN